MPVTLTVPTTKIKSRINDRRPSATPLTVHTPVVVIQRDVQHPRTSRGNSVHPEEFAFEHGPASNVGYRRAAPAQRELAAEVTAAVLGHHPRSAATRAASAYWRERLLVGPCRLFPLLDDSLELPDISRWVSRDHDGFLGDGVLALSQA